MIAESPEFIRGEFVKGENTARTDARRPRKLRDAISAGRKRPFFCNFSLGAAKKS